MCAGRPLRYGRYDASHRRRKRTRLRKQRVQQTWPQRQTGVPHGDEKYLHQSKYKILDEITEFAVGRS